MSKKYDEYISQLGNESDCINYMVMSDKPYLMLPKPDQELTREIRDRAIIGLVTKAVKEGKELSYGDIRLLIDDDVTEKEYEGSKDNAHFTK